MFFNDKAPSVPDEDFEGLLFCGLPMWAPKGRGVYVWAIDMVVESDERWVVFGPFEDGSTAKKKIERVVKSPKCWGYRIEYEHSFPSILRRSYSRLPANMYTDG